MKVQLHQHIELNPHGQLQLKLHMMEVASSIADKISQLSQSQFSHCICRVPDCIREVNPHCYTPRLVSIGPFHRDNPRLKSKEDLKLRYFSNFLARIGDKALQSLSLYVVKMGSDIRNHYPPDEIKLSTKDFCEMILIDAVFIVELLIKKEEKDPSLENTWLFFELLNDIFLIENQIPLFVPNEVYSQFFLLSNNKTIFLDLVANFIKNVNNEMSTGYPIGTSSSNSEGKALHFLDYLRQAYTFGVHRPLPLGYKDQKPEVVTTASRLLEYGVKFVKDTTNPLVKIQFKPKEGILTIPRVKVNEWTENLFRNLVAFEQCDFLAPKYVCDYLIFMDSLIDTPEDVNILINAGIIQDDLQNPGKISEIFNTLHKEVITEGRNYLFFEQSRDLNDYRRDLWHRWKASWYKWKWTLKRDYFNSPWSTIAFITAFILSGLTIVQTVCSIYQAKQTKFR